MSRIKNWVVENHDLAFAILLAVCVYCYFAFTNDLFATHRTTFAIMERFAVLGLVGLALTLCIIAGEIDLSIGSNAALAAVIVVRFTDSLGAVPALLIAVAISTTIGMIQGYFIAYLRVRAIVLTVGTLMLLRGVALFAAEEKNRDAYGFQSSGLHYNEDVRLLFTCKYSCDFHVHSRWYFHELYSIWS